MARRRPRDDKTKAPAKIRRSPAEAGAEKVGDPMVMAFSWGLQMIVVADLLNRLRLAETSLTDEDTFGLEGRERVEETYFADMRAALMTWKAMARSLPLDVIREQRAIWEEEAARLALPLWDAWKDRDWARTLYRRAKAMYDEGVAAGTKKEAIYADIAAKLLLSDEDKALSDDTKRRKVLRILRQNKKTRGGVFDIDRQLFARKPRTFHSITGERWLDEFDPDAGNDPGGRK